MNLPNKLTVIRFFMIPLCMACILFPIGEADILWRLLAAAVFGIASLTDYIDGHIARKYGLITDLGKFLDPLADKLLVFGVFIALTVKYQSDPVFSVVFVWVIFIVILREYTVTSLRMICAQKAGAVLAARWLGKCKTVSQMVCIFILLLEDLFPFGSYHILSYVSLAVVVVLTVWSGLDYLHLYLPLLDREA